MLLVPMLLFFISELYTCVAALSELLVSLASLQRLEQVLALADVAVPLVQALVDCIGAQVSGTGVQEHRKHTVSR